MSKQNFFAPFPCLMKFRESDSVGLASLSDHMFLDLFGDGHLR